MSQNHKDAYSNVTDKNYHCTPKSSLGKSYSSYDSNNKKLRMQSNASAGGSVNGKRTLIHSTSSHLTTRYAKITNPSSSSSISSSQLSKRCRDNFSNDKSSSNFTQPTGSGDEGASVNLNRPEQRPHQCQQSLYPPSSPNSGSSSQTDNSPILVRVKAWYAMSPDIGRLSC